MVIISSLYTVIQTTKQKIGPSHIHMPDRFNQPNKKMNRSAWMGSVPKKQSIPIQPSSNKTHPKFSCPWLSNTSAHAGIFVSESLSRVEALDPRRAKTTHWRVGLRCQGVRLVAAETCGGGWGWCGWSEAAPSDQGLGFHVVRGGSYVLRP
jgi:hypothetical protein